MVVPTDARPSWNLADKPHAAFVCARTKTAREVAMLGAADFVSGVVGVKQVQILIIARVETARGKG